MGDDPVRLYRLDGVAHIAGVINDEPQRCIASMRRQQGMRLDEKYVPAVASRDAHILHAVWRVHDHTTGCDIPIGVAGRQTLCQWLLDGFPDIHTGGCPAWVWFQELLGVLPLANQIQKFAVNCTWFQEAFGECPEGADEETVRRYACAYIMMLLGTQLFADKSGNHIHIRWLPYVARLEEMGSYNWGSAALAWLYRCMCRVANTHVVKLAGPLQLLQSWIFWRFPGFRAAGYDTFSWPLASRWAGHNPSASEKGPRVQMWRLRIDLLQARDFIWMPYNSPDILQVLHPEVLESRHTALIYFAVIEWHQIDRVLPQFGRVQPRPQPALNIDFLMSKDGRGRDRWFPYNLQFWHLYWDSRANHVLRFDVVADPGPSHDFLEWWGQHGKRFLSPEMYLGDPRAVPIPVEATQRGAGRVPDIDLVDDVLDRRRVERRARVGTRRSQREWRWLDQAMEEDDAVVRDGGRRRGRGG
ncbi:serine/threonine-protein phosphatase 7 long form homolog [Arachis hypogaea]|uniref:serine/threonine-protein phosphatase 7 long form homolog n=1 Tax=Arachis hypogaea TaxID=3818 RepID=UPI003B222688